MLHINFSISKNSTNGFTLIEFMVTIVLLLVFITLASPSGNVLNRLQAKNAIGQLSGSVKLAFTSANHLGKNVTICASSDGSTCSGTNDWSQGWIVFYEEPSLEIIQVSTPPSSVAISGFNFLDNDTLVIEPVSRSLDSDANFGVFAACYKNTKQGVAGIIVSNIGFFSVSEDSNSDGIIEDRNNNNLTCV